jgi:hypothetical protein
MTFDDLKVGDNYIAVFHKPFEEDKNDKWIFEVVEINDARVKCQYLIILGGTTEIDDYHYNKDDFNNSINLVKKVSQKTDPEYYL